MNIEDLTIKQAKEVVDFLTKGNNQPITTAKNLIDYRGKYVIVRSSNEGINCGVVKCHDDTGVVLTEARRIYYHKPKDTKTSWYEGVSVSGLSRDSKISNPVLEKVIVEAYSFTLCTEEAIESLKTHSSNEQN